MVSNRSFLIVIFLLFQMHCVLSNTESSTNLPEFVKEIDLLSKRVGGKVISFSDQFFAEAENLMKPEKPVFKPHTFTDRGQLMDGWETRRHNPNEFDWVILKLGLSGTIHGVMIDTAYFTGNHGPQASLEAITMDDEPSAEQLERSDKVSHYIFFIIIHFSGWRSFPR